MPSSAGSSSPNRVVVLVMTQVMWTVIATGWEAGVQAMMGLQFGCCSAEMKVQLHVTFRNWQQTQYFFGTVKFLDCVPPAGISKDLTLQN
jgi:hypothetical protein